MTALCHDEVKADDGKRLTVAGFVAHPSFLKYPGDIEKIVLPYSCAASEIDPQMSADNAKQTEEILKSKTAKTKDQGVEHEFVMYEGVHHGFAGKSDILRGSQRGCANGFVVRADEDAKHEAEAGKKAEKQALSWFTRWFANPPPA